MRFINRYLDGVECPTELCAGTEWETCSPALWLPHPPSALSLRWTDVKNMRMLYDSAAADHTWHSSSIFSSLLGSYQNFVFPKHWEALSSYSVQLPRGTEETTMDSWIHSRGKLHTMNVICNIVSDSTKSFLAFWNRYVIETRQREVMWSSYCHQFE